MENTTVSKKKVPGIVKLSQKAYFGGLFEKTVIHTKIGCEHFLPKLFCR